MPPHLSTKNSNAFSLQTTLAKLHEDGTGDATLLSSIDGTSVPVNKFVMAMRSEFFQAKFFGEYSQKFSESSVVNVDYEGKVLLAIKSFCYMDKCDNGFSEFNEKTKYFWRLSRRQRLDEVMTEEERSSSAVFLVSLTAAADYFLLTGLTRMLWKVAYQIMMFYFPETIPTIYGEAMNQGCEELRKLAWHSYWLSPQNAPGYSNEVVGDSQVESTGDESLPQSFEGPDPNVDYDGLGVILVMGCSDKDFNGDYYGSDTYAEDICYTNYEYVFFEKVKKDKRGIRAQVRQEKGSSGDELYALSHYVPYDDKFSDSTMCHKCIYFVHTKDRIPCEWEGVRGTSGIPPTCFVFKRGNWFPFPETIASKQRAGGDSESDSSDDSESHSSDGSE